MRGFIINRKLTIIALKIALAVVHGLTAIKRPARSLVLLLKDWSAPPLRFTFRWLIVRPYALYLRWRREAKRRLGGLNPLELSRHHQIVLYMALAGAMVVSLNSFKIRNVQAEDFGQNNLIFPLIQEDFESLAVDSVPLTPPPTSLHPGETPITMTSGGMAILKPFLITTQPGIAGRDRLEYYMIKSGDSLSGIATHFGLNLTTLLWENRLTERSLLRIGQKLTILPVDGVSYRIGRGDTVARIADRFRARPNDITTFNQLGSKLTVGQTIIIPGGRPPVAPTPPAPKPKITVPLVNLTPPTSAPRSNTRLAWPTVSRRLSQYFTWRHGGIDVPNSKGTPIWAAEEGIVEAAGWNRGGYGYYIIIDHGGGLKTLYGHNSKLLVNVGDRVERGQQISEMGSTGRSTGSHLHFEVRLNGRRVNPLGYTR